MYVVKVWDYSITYIVSFETHLPLLLTYCNAVNVMEFENTYGVETEINNVINVDKRENIILF